MRTAALAVLVWTAAFGLGHAAESGPIATAPAAASSSSADDTAAQIEAYLSRADAPDLANVEAEPPTGPRKMHGEVGASIGTGGYRSGYAIVDMPFGQNNDLGVAVQSTRYPSRHGRGGGTSQSLALSLNINGPLGVAAPDCMHRTGTKLLSDEKTEAECARLRDKDAAPH